jgi:hypothetical protein
MMKTFTSARAKSSHPVQTEITLPVENFYRFSCLIDNSDDVRIVAYSDAEDGMMIVYIACLNHDVAEAIQDGWA